MVKCVSVFICAGESNAVSDKKSYWWIIGIVAALLLVAGAGILAYRKLKGKTGIQRDRNTDLHIKYILYYIKDTKYTSNK